MVEDVSCGNIVVPGEVVDVTGGVVVIPGGISTPFPEGRRNATVNTELIAIIAIIGIANSPIFFFHTLFLNNKQNALIR